MEHARTQQIEDTQAPAVARPALAPPLVEAAQAGPSLGALASRPPAVRAGVLRSLSRSAGNQWVSRAVLARDGAGGAGGAGGATAAPPSAGAGGGAPDRIDIAGASAADRLAEIPKAIRDHDPGYLVDLWISLGVKETARANEALFVQSAALAPVLYGDFEDVEDEFKRAVEGRALAHLGANRAYVAAEMTRLGVADGPPSTLTSDQGAAIAETQKMAANAARALKAKQELLAVPVAIVYEDGGGERTHANPMKTVTFEPGNRVALGPGDQPGAKTWDEVDAQWQQAEDTLAGIEATSPGVFAMVSQGQDHDGLAGAASAAGDLATADPKSAAAYLESALGTLMARLEEVAAEIGGGYDWDDLGLLHEQVLAAPPFDKPVEGAVARHLVADTVHAKEAIDTALTTVGMIAALLGVFATGGMAAALAVTGAAASSGQAIRSIADYDTVAGLRQARTGDKAHDLVTQDTLDAAQQQAILDAIFAFLDTVGAVKALKALGGVEEVAERLGRFGTLDAAEKEQVFGAAMQGMGEAKALDRVGGLVAARGQLQPGSAALQRAEAYSKRVVDELADALGARELREAAAAQAAGQRAAEAAPKAARPPEELLREAQAHVAAKTGLPPERALQTVCPQAANAQDLARVVERAAASAAELSEEWARLGAAEARAQAIHRRTLEFAAMNRLPPPELQMGAGFHFDKDAWAIQYDRRLLSEAKASNALWEYYRSAGVHELTHADQFVECARIAMGKADQAALDVRGALNLHPKGLEEARRRGLLRPGQAGYEEASRWYESFFGGGAADRKQVLDELKAHAEQLDARRVAHEEAAKLAEEYAEAIDDGAPRRLKEDLAARRLEAERRARAADKAVADNQAARDENYRRYRELPEEQHAWAEQEEYQRAMAAEREAQVAAKEAEAARQRAEEAARRAEEEAPATERRPGAEVDDPSHIDDEDAVWDPDRDPLGAAR